MFYEDPAIRIFSFDNEGEETASNTDYSGFTMDFGLGEDSSDFRRLLKGIPSIAHNVSTDPTTGLTRQMIGVTMPPGSPSGKPEHGALIMTVIPNQTEADAAEISRQAFILKIDILILVLLPALIFLGGSNDSFGGGSLLQFILYGDWMRGLNMFAVCSIVIVIAVGFLILVLCNALLSMIAGFCERGGETICRLLYSFSRYVVALTILYYVFEYIGLSLSTYFASLGMVSLTSSLGSKEMVADIVAGIMILFEHQFQVGDSVIPDGSSGIVLEIGVRSTKLPTADNSIRFINNTGIRSVVNKSKCLSAFQAEFTVVSSEPLEKIEELFNKALPEIGKKKPDDRRQVPVGGHRPRIRLRQA